MRKWNKNMDSVVVVIGLALVLFIIIPVMTATRNLEIPQNNTVIKHDTIFIEQPIDLDGLDVIKEILYYEVVDNQLYLYTKKDSIQDAIERWNYIRSLDPDIWEDE